MYSRYSKNDKRSQSYFIGNKFHLAWLFHWPRMQNIKQTLMSLCTDLPWCSGTHIASEVQVQIPARMSVVVPSPEEPRVSIWGEPAHWTCHSRIYRVRWHSCAPVHYKVKGCGPRYINCSVSSTIIFNFTQTQLLEYTPSFLILILHQIFSTWHVTFKNIRELESKDFPSVK